MALGPVGRRTALLWSLLGATVLLDRLTKIAATAALSSRGRQSFLGDLFRLEYVHNHGAFLSLGAKLPEPWRGLLFTYGVGFFLLGLLIMVERRSRKGLFGTRPVIGYALVVGGGLSNLWDRATGGAVIDFLNLGIGRLRTGIFNIADVAIVAGVILVAWAPGRAKAEGRSTADEASPPAPGPR